MKRLKTALLLLVSALLLAACTTKLPILAVQLADDDGSNAAPITKKELSEWVDAANLTWEEADYTVVFRGNKDMATVRSTVLNTQPPDNAYDQWELYRIMGNYVASLLPPDRIPVYFRQRGGGAWSWGPGDTNFVSMPSYANTCIAKSSDKKPCPGGCCPNTTLFSHELGHYLGLAHTFTDVTCDQATLNNTDGDRFGQLAGVNEDDIKDTNPDPGAACAPTTALKCNEGPVKVNGEMFAPPWRNLMSNHACLPQRISDDQAKVVKYTLDSPWRNRLGKDD